MNLIEIKPNCAPQEMDKRLNRIEENAFSVISSEVTPEISMEICTAEELEMQILLERLKGQKIMFSVSLNICGMNMELFNMIQVIRKYKDAFSESTGIILIDGKNDFDTKETARMIAAAANDAGCAFIGMPVVEGTGSLYNYQTQAKITGMSLEEAYVYALADRIRRLAAEDGKRKAEPRLLCLHACTGPRSNSLKLGQMICDHLPEKIMVETVNLFREEVHDCAGCTFESCLAYAGKGGCRYDDSITKQLYPAVQRCSAVMILAPNYNDAVGANLSACINRLTAPYRIRPFFEKALFSVIVSGYSGGDVVQKQLIDGWNMNKGFFLPGCSSLHETMNEPGGIGRISGIEERAAAFALRITQELLY